MTQARIRLTPELADLSRSAWEELIREANLGTEASEIARRYYINKECQIDIAIDKNTDRTQISRIISNSRRKMLLTLQKNILQTDMSLTTLFLLAR